MRLAQACRTRRNRSGTYRSSGRCGSCSARKASRGAERRAAARLHARARRARRRTRPSYRMT
eukprot:5217595-Pyramimonas_sp.AAC.1